jgi:hypothetical protein
MWQEAAQRAALAASVARDEIEAGLVCARERLAAVEAEIASTVISNLAWEFEAGLATLREAVDAANAAMAQCLGWRQFQQLEKLPSWLD